MFQWDALFSSCLPSPSGLRGDVTCGAGARACLVGGVSCKGNKTTAALRCGALVSLVRVFLTLACFIFSFLVCHLHSTVTSAGLACLFASVLATSHIVSLHCSLESPSSFIRGSWLSARARRMWRRCKPQRNLNKNNDNNNNNILQVGGTLIVLETNNACLTILKIRRCPLLLWPRNRKPSPPPIRQGLVCLPVRECE